MSKASVVIGASYGDEGKGLVTDYLVDRDSANMVVRFNGGAQAGHTVVTPAGQRHVFGHFAAGTFQGARTYLSRHFVANPMLYFKEKAALEAMGMGTPKRMMADPRVIISTPYDMIVNQAVENHRNGGRHGSCGVGFGETIERNTRIVRVGNFNSDMLRITAQDISGSNLSDMFYKLEVIRREWVPGRLNELGIPYTKELQATVMSVNLMKKFIDDLNTFGNDELVIVPTSDIKCLGPIVFEGAQGLALDQHQGIFPHVTRSTTGIKNVLEICGEAKITDLEVYYATRAYLTRHGAGPMENELKKKPYKGIIETTNITNEFQGSFRFGNLDVDELKTRIATDLRIANHYHAVKISPKLAVTCVDQLDDMARIVVNGKLKRVHRDDIAKEITQAVGLPYFLESKGPTRTTIKERLAV